MEKKTKIVATISGLRCGVPFLKKLHKAGMDAVRMNTAHMDEVEALNLIKNVRKVSSKISIMIDTKGPEVRTTKVEQSVHFHRGDEVKVCFGTGLSSKECIYVNYKDFVRQMSVNDGFYIDDGMLAFKVTSKRGKVLVCRARNSGILRSRKTVNVPGVKLSMPALTPKDRRFIAFGIKHDVDFIAHSFVRNKNDVLTIQRMLDKKKSKIKIIAKIENQEGVDNIDEILDHAAGVMIARGDLAVEIPAQRVPLVQKQLIKKCLIRAKPVITATQMLHSMIDHPRPTRAEVSDVANAIFDGTDAVMLSGETAEGKFAEEAVKMMRDIALGIELERSKKGARPLSVEPSINNYLTQSAVQASIGLDTKALVVATTSGHSARLVSRFRGKTPIYAKCFSERVVRELSLSYGVYPDLLKVQKKHAFKVLPQVLTSLMKVNGLKKSDLVTLLTGIPGKGGFSTSLVLITIGDAQLKYR